MGLIFIKVVESFKYEKNNNRYQDGAKLYKQGVEKTLYITKAFYPRYLLYFLFDNSIGYFVYAKNAFQVKKMNKEVGEKQLWLRNRWFDYKNELITYYMTFFNKKEEVTQKKV